SLYPTQNVIEVVCNTAGQRSHALQFLSSQRVLLGTLDFRDVLDHAQPVEGIAIVIKDKGFRQVNPNALTILLHIALLQAVAGYLAPEKPSGKLHFRTQVIRVRDIGKSHLDECLLRVTYHLTKCMVNLQEAMVPSHKCYTQRSLFKHPAETF